jgi:cytochrome P450
VNTFLFAGSDTMSLTLSWTLLLLARHDHIQCRLRKELLSVTPGTNIQDLTEDEIQALFAAISDLPYLHNVLRESMRLVPALHSSLRVATKDDQIPTSYPIRDRKGSLQAGAHVYIPKGSFVHVAVEAMNLDKEIWGPDAWEFK